MKSASARELIPLTEAAAVLHSFGSSIREEWRYRLADSHAGLSAKKREYVTKSINSGNDVLSLLIENLRIGQLDDTDVSLILPRINSVEYSIEDFSVELRLLKRSIYTTLEKVEEISTENKLRTFSTASIACDYLMEDVLRPTSVVYEQVIESGARGFVRVDDNGIVIYANKKIIEIADGANPTGNSIYKYFNDEDARYIQERLKHDISLENNLRKMRWKGASGWTKELNAEVVPFDSGGYLYFSELSFILDTHTQIYDKHPFAIVELDPNVQVTYANPAACKLFGVSDLVGENYHQYVAENQESIISHQLDRRRKGFTDSYRIWLINKTSGKQFEAQVVSVPHFDQAGTYVGVFVILELLSVKNAIESIDQATSESISQAEYCEDGMKTLFVTVYEALLTLFNADVLFVSLLSKDSRHVRVLYQNSDSQMKTRWFPMSDELCRWNNQEKVTAIGDLEEFLQKNDPDLLNDSVVQSLISQNLISWLRYPVHEDNRVIAIISLAATGKHRFTVDDEKTMAELPLDRVMMKALFFERQKELQLVNQLTREVQGSKTPDEIGAHLCSLLVTYYSWQNVSFFILNRKRDGFKLITQDHEPTIGFHLEESYEQTLDEGVLGRAYEKDATILINDVTNDPIYSGDFIRISDNTQSELCVPVHHNNRIYGLINVEHSQINAFSVDDRELLEEIVTEVEMVLDRLSWQHQLNAAFNEVSDPVFFVDNKATIRAPNKAAATIFEIEDGQPLNYFGRYFDDFGAANKVLEDLGGGEYSGIFRVDGIRMYATFNKVKMPEHFDGYVCTLKNISAAKRQQELEAIRHQFMDLAREVKTPISLVSSWLDRLQMTLAGSEEAGSKLKISEDLVSKIKTQMQDIDIGYDSFLYNDDDLINASSPGTFLVSRLIERSLSEFPVCVRNSIRLESADPELMVYGHMDSLSFAVKSIFSFLFRYAQDDAVLALSVLNKDEVYVALEISEHRQSESSSYLPGVQISDNAISAEPEYHDLAAGDVVIRRIVDHHEGRYQKKRNVQGLWRFQLEVPRAVSHTRS